MREVFTSKIGVIAAENTGLNTITNEIIAFIDDDGYAPPHWLSSIEKFFIDHPYAAAVGGPDIIMSEPWTYSDFPTKDIGLITWYGKVIGNHHRKALGQLRTVDVLKGVNMAFKRNFVDFIDENLAGAEGHLGNGSQWELDLCLRVKNKGGKIFYSPDLVVSHDSDHSNHDYIQAAKNNTHNLCYVMLKNLSKIKKIIFIFYALLIGNIQLPGLIKNLSELTKKPNKLTFQIIRSKYIGFFYGILTFRRFNK